MCKKIILICIVLLYTSVQAQDKNQKIHLLWDASYSMAEKDIAKEYLFLKALLDSSSSEIALTVFSNTTQKKLPFSNTNFSNLKDILTTIPYDGKTTIPIFKNYDASSLLLYITDGEKEMILPEDFNGNIFVISSIVEIPKNSFAQNPVPYINLNFIETDEAINIVNGKKPITNHTTFLKQKLKEQQTQKSFALHGTITDQYGPLNNVRITSLGSLEETTSNAQGYYNIQTFEDDIVSFVTENDISRNLRIISSKEKEINLILDENINSLSEVFIQKKKTDEAKTFMGKDLEEDRKLGYTVSQLNAEDLRVGQITIGQMIASRVPGVQFLDNANKSLGSIVLRGFSSIQGSNVATVVLDGAIISSANSATGRFDDFSFIDPSTVENIRVLKGLAATSQYGAQGVNGVIVITTKSGRGFSEKEARTNIYEGELRVATANNSYRQLKNLLDQEPSTQAAYQRYLKERELPNNKANIRFYFDAFDYFQQKGEPMLGIRIASNVEELFGKNPEIILALAYKYDQKYQFKQSLILYKDLFEQDQKSIQNKRNYAQSLCKNGFFTKGFALYLQLINDALNPLPDDLKATMIREMKHAYQIQSAKEDLSNIGIPNFLKESTKADGRLVFEWNKTEANFDLQFINPDKLYYNWKHNENDAFDRMSQERKQQIGMKEFMLVDAEKGQWFFNIVHPENYTNDTETFIKVTLVKNYGEANESQTIKLVQLSKIDATETVASLLFK